MKTKRKINEIDIIHEYLKSNIATATQVAKALNIYRPNVCRHKRTLEKEGALIEVRKGPCPHTKHIASFLTTNPEILKEKN